MPTPTSPAPLPNGDDAEETPFAPPERGTGALDAFAEGRVASADVARLSDLDRDAAARFRAEWASLPEPARERIVREMDELAEDRVELNFGRALRVALEDSSPVVRQLAVAALWEDERDDLLDLLRGVLATDESQDVRAGAAQALGRFAALVAAGERDEALAEAVRDDLFAVADDPDQPYLVRRRALESLGVFGQEPEVRRLILDAYESGDQGMQASALYAMGESLDAAWLPTLLAELVSDEAELRFEAARACGVLGSESSVAELAECAADEDPEVRQAAIAALGQIGGRGAIRVLRALAGQAEEADQEAVAAALEEATAAEDPFGAGAE